MNATQSAITLAPLIILGAVLGTLIFVPIPVPNKDLAMTIVAGLLGYLSKGERPTPSSTVTTGSPPDQTTVTTQPQP